jgi:hypothetical protein
MDKKSYSELLQHPKWQEKRLRILERDGFKCTSPGCQNTEQILHVHHLDYKKGNAPWEYDDSWLITLCRDCHEIITSDRPWFERELVKAFRLKAKYNIDHCFTVQVFEIYNDVSSLMFFLWTLDEKDVLNLLHRHFNGLIPEEHLQPLKCIKSNA